MVNPILFSIGLFELRYYSILLAIAFLLGYIILSKLINEVEKDKVDKFLLHMIIWMIIGARLFEVFFYNPSYYFSNLIKIFYIWEGGIASHGALIAAILVTYRFTKKENLKFYDIADKIVIPVALGASLVRLGNFFNGELVGKLTNVKWAVKFNNYEGMRHPVQIYQSISHLISFFILIYVRTLKNLPKGFLFWLFMLMFSVFRFFTEFYKDLPFGYGLQAYGLNLAQYLSIFILVISVIYMFKIFKKA